MVSGVRTGRSGKPVGRGHLPFVRLQLFGSAARLRVRLAAWREIKAFAVNAHAGCDDQLLHRMLHQSLQQNRRTQIIHAGVFRDLVHALAHADQCDEMINGVHARQRPVQNFRIAHVAQHKLGILVQISGTLRRFPMYLGDKAIQNPHVIASP